MYSYQKYQNSDSNRITQASPEKLVAMLLEGALMQLKIAKERHLADQPVAWREAVNRAMRIVNYLSECLDMEKGGEIAKNLEQIYYSAMAKLYDAARATNPVPHIEPVERIIDKIYRSWLQATSGK